VRQPNQVPVPPDRERDLGRWTRGRRAAHLLRV